MKITFVLTTVSIGGGVKVAGIYAKALADKGHEIVLVSLPPQAIPIRRKIKSFITGRGWPRLRQPNSYLDDLGLDHRVLDSRRPVADKDVPDADVVIATWWETADWVAALSDMKGAKVYFIQGHETFPYCPKERVQATYKLPLHKITISNWLVEIMRKEYDEHIVDLVPNSVDQKIFFASPRARQARPTVGLLYSKSPVKGVDVSIAALNILVKKYPDLRVLSFGTEEPDAQHPLPNFVEFQKLPPQNSLRDIYSSCDVWLTASRTEGFNLTAMEAMACRVPVVSTKTGWPDSAIVNGHNGFLVAVDDVHALTQGVDFILSLPENAWREMSENAFDTVALSSWQQSANQFEMSLERACQRSRSNID